MQNNHNLQAVIYCRVSSMRQVTEGHGLSSQESRCRDYAKHKGYNVIESFYDEGVSGSLTERAGMLELLESFDEQIIVIIDDISRLARGLEAHIQLRTTIQSAGGKLESPSIEFGEDSDSLLVENLLASVSQHQREKNREQVINRMRARVLNGYWCGAPVPGLKYAKLPEHGKILVHDEPVASIIKEIMEGFASGRFDTQSEIKRFLETQEAFPKDKNGLVHAQRVHDILTRPLYAGYISWPTWNIILHPAKHKPIVSFETFKAVQDKLQAHAKKPQQSFISHEFPLRGYVTCSCCNHPLTAGMPKGRKKRYAYYWCAKKGCDLHGKMIQRDAMEKDFRELLEHLKPSQDLFYIALEAFKMLWDKRRSCKNVNKQAITDELNQIEAKIKKLVDRIVVTESQAIVETYEKSIHELEEKRILLKEKMQSSQNHQPNFEQAFKRAFQFLANPLMLWDSEHIADKKAALKLLFTDKLSYDKHQGFLNRPIAQPLKAFGLFTGGQSEMVEQGGSLEYLSSPCIKSIIKTKGRQHFIFVV